MQSRRGEAPGGGVSRVEQVLRHERGVTGAGLAVLTLLAWWYVWTGAGTGMPATAMTALALFPHLTMEMGGMTTAAPVGWAMALVMWWVMMIAMMTPSAAPLVLLYGRVLRHHCAQADDGAAVASSFYLVGGYLTAWLVFAIAAATLQAALQPADLTSATMLWSKSAVLSATVLLAAGLYQLSSLKSACLRQCRGPAAFLTRYWRPGRLGAFAMGVRHGAWCVGCCWMLMALLFVGGIMNLVWIAAIALLVLAEKLAPAGPAVSKVTGVVLLAWGVSTLLV
jgi:predicted metal-binding membrane protein